MDETAPAHGLLPAIPSQLTSQLQKEQLNQNLLGENQPPTQDPRFLPKQRSWSSLELKPTLSPSPEFLEPAKASKDDSYVIPGPTTPKRPAIHPRGLSLQMPPRDISSSSTANLTTNLINRGPLSPKLDSTPFYGCVGSVLPRRSRGLDFSRACTNLHHSTLAEQSSPDSSPVISGRSMMIPPRKGLQGSSQPSIPSSPASAAHSLWSTMGNVDKPLISGSLGSVNMLDSSSDSETSDMDITMRREDDEDTIHMTPQAGTGGFFTGSPFIPGVMASPSMDTVNPFSPSAGSLMSFRRARLRNNRSRKSSSSASASRRSSMPSPGPVSPPLLKSIESSMGLGYFNKDLSRKDVESRRQSLSLGTGDLHISDGADSDVDAIRISPTEGLGIPIPMTPTADDRRQVIRRAVTRRSNLLPKPKGLARIRAALQEEGSPVDAECRREAEVIRQVRESDASEDPNGVPHSGQATTASSPSLFPAVTAGPTGLLDEISDGDLMTSELPPTRRPSSSFSQHAIRHSAGVDFWNKFDESTRTPPPDGKYLRSSSTGIGDEMNMDPPSTYNLAMLPSLPTHQSSRSRSSTPQPPVTTIELPRVQLGKRRRDDDLDPNMFKRRAVSPGVSLQNSPIMPPSPAQRSENGWWAMQQAKAREGSGSGSTSSNGAGSGAGVGSGGPMKRIGFQGMSDTNDGLMNMSIE